MGLLLEAVDVAGPSRWRWLLTDEKTGSRLAGHRVELDPGSDEVARFRDLYGYARWRAAPDRRFEDEARIVHAAGGWAGAELLGESVGAAIAARAPVTVRVVIPAPAEPVLLWPLELAHVAGSPLAARGDVALVYDIAPDRPGQLKDPVAETLRILAVFSLPTGTAVAAIRRERYALSQLIRRIAARDGGAVELRVVQYGVTRQRLKQIADSADGWDVLHLSGHGGRGLFALEHADGTPDHVSGADLAELLRPARRRAKLAMVWACRSAADGTAETRRPAGLAGHAEAEAGHAEQVPGLARALVRELDCAVVAMRYLVTSEFTSAFAEAFYEHLLSGRQPVDAAAARVLAELAAPGPTAVSAVSLATPGVFGSRAAGLTLVAPPRRPRPDLASRRMAYLPDEPARFVGRAAAMARASAALAPDSGKTAVLLCGMAGTGKTACALELAHRYRDGFAAAAFWRAPARVPARGDERAGALADLADTLATQLADYGFTGTAGLEKLVPRTRAAKLERFLSRLRQGLRDSRVLLVLDNLETLLTPEGTWSDPRLGRLITGLTGHEGGSRLILTSRVAPTGLGAGVLTLPIPELLPGEAAELARELPNLRRLLHVDWEPAEAQAGEEADWERYRRVRRVVRGHPRLLELADAGAADRNQLDARLAAADAAPAGQQLTSFLLHAPALDAAGFLNVFTTWAAAALAALPPPTRLMAEFLACLEDGDRKRTVVDQNWTDLWRRLARPGDPADPGTQLDALIAATLIQPGPHGDPVSYLMHPAVCTAIRDAVAPGVREAADIGLAAFWKAAAYQALNRDGGEDSETVVSAGLAAAPYLLRRREWDVAASLLGKVIARDRSYETLQAALPALRSIVDATGAPAHQAVLASVLETADVAESERQLRDVAGQSARDGNYQLASTATGDLVELLIGANRLAEALRVLEQKAGYARQAGAGPWTRLSGQGQRLRILGLMGRRREVFSDGAVLLAQADKLPEHADSSETVIPWQVTENILDTCRVAAWNLGEWQACLDLNARLIASRRRRGADSREISMARFSDVVPLAELGRLSEAGQLLQACQEDCEEHGDNTWFAAILTTRAGLEGKLGHHDAAVDLERTYLRLMYVRPEPWHTAASHWRLGSYLNKAGIDPAGQRAHLSAAALIFRLIRRTSDLAGAEHALARLVPGNSGPATLGEVIAAAERTDGVHLGELICVLEPDRYAAESAFAQIQHAVASLPSPTGGTISGLLKRWGPAAVSMARSTLNRLAADNGGQEQ